MRTSTSAATTALPPQPEARGYAFGPFLVDPIRRLLWRDRRVVALGGKTFDLLLVLLKNRTRLIDKDELLRLVWPDAVVQENNLVRHISTLRRALGQKLEQHEPIVTVSGRGYRFVADIVALDELPKDLPSSANGHKPAPESESEPPPALNVDAGLPLPPASSQPWQWSRQAIVGLLGIASIAAIVAVIILSRPTSRAETASRTLRQFTYEAGLQQTPTWAPDGTKIAYASDTGGQSDIWIQSVDNPTPQRLTRSTAADYQPAWSPDGRFIAFRSERDGGGLYVIAAAGGDPRRIADGGFLPRWSPDSSTILFDSLAVRGPRSTSYVVGIEGGTPTPLRQDLIANLNVISAGWAPDGRISILGRDRSDWRFVTGALREGAATASAVSAKAAEQLTGVALRRFTWSPRGTALFFEGESSRVNNVWRVTVQPKTLEWVSAERMTSGTGQDGDIAVSSDGARLAFSARSEMTRLWAFPFDNASATITGAGQPVTSGGAGEYDAAATLDGSKVAYRTVRAERQELWEHSVNDGRDRLLLATNDSNMTSPRWSRDGTRLAYSRSLRDARNRSVAILPVNGGPEAVVKIAQQMDFVPDDWSPDGATLLGACIDGTSSDRGMCLMPSASTSMPAQVRIIASDPNLGLLSPRFSPNQRWISFMAVDRARGRSTIHVMPSGGGAWTPVTDGAWYDDKPRWSTDGRTLLFISNRGGLLNLWGRRFDPDSGRAVGEPFRITQFDDLQRALPLSLGPIEIAVATNRVFLPVRETTGKIWILDRVDK